MSILMMTNTTTKDFISFDLPNSPKGLPFPMHLQIHWKLLIATSLLITLVQGARLRKVIFSFINSPEAGLGPINYLIWVDQVNRILPVFYISMRIFFILSPISINQILGPFACTLTEFVAATYLFGSCYWNCSIAVFRVLFTKAQTWLTRTVGIRSMLVGMLVTGFGAILTGAFLSISYDNHSALRKMCSHHSTEYLEIKEAYMVNLCFYLQC